MKILILDDDLNRHKQFNNKLIGHIVTNTYTSKEAIQKLKEENYDLIFLDYDLGGKILVTSGQNTGYEVAQWISENMKEYKGRIIIHSFNPVGAANMKALLPSAEIIPGAWGFIM